MEDINRPEPDDGIDVQVTVNVPEQKASAVAWPDADGDEVGGRCFEWAGLLADSNGPGYSPRQCPARSSSSQRAGPKPRPRPSGGS